MTAISAATCSHRDLVKAPVQARSAATLQRILAAAIEAFDEQEYGRVSMSEIALRAEVSVATLYTRFKDKEALLDYLFSHLQSTRLAEVRARFLSEGWAGTSAAERIGRLINHLVAGMASHVGLFRAFSNRQLLNQKTPSEIACEEEVATLQATWLREGAMEEGRDLSERPARMAVSLITSSARLQIVFGITCGLSRDDFVEQLSTAVRAFVDAACAPIDHRGEPSG